LLLRAGNDDLWVLQTNFNTASVYSVRKVSFDSAPTSASSTTDSGTTTAPSNDEPSNDEFFWMFIFFGLILVIALFFFVGNKIRANNQKKRDADGLLMADYEDRTYQRLEI